MTINILLADDHEVVRHGLRHMLEQEPDMCIAGEAATGRDAVRLAGELKPAVIIMDISMPDMNGIEATRQIRKLDADPKIIVLSMHYKRQFVTDMIQAGISGYVLKANAAEELVRAIRVAVEGEVYLCPKITAILTQDYKKQSISESSGRSVLSPREREILQLISEGLSTKVMANHLHISIKTIESTRRQIMQKLDIHSIAGLTKYAIHEGITSVEF